MTGKSLKTLEISVFFGCPVIHWKWKKLLKNGIIIVSKNGRKATHDSTGKIDFSEAPCQKMQEELVANEENFSL